MVVSEITDNCLYTGLFGSLDSTRMAAVSDKLTATSERAETRHVIVDLGNVDAIDSAVANQLVRLADTLMLVGVKTIFCGIKGVIARTMVGAGITLNGYHATRDLKSALQLSLKLTAEGH